VAPTKPAAADESLSLLPNLKGVVFGCRPRLRLMHAVAAAMTVYIGVVF
jgi:hypothetical protein